MLDDSPSPRDDARPLATGLFALVALVAGLIVLGALVRAHEAGLACPDWPLCFGEWVPRMNLQVAFEWSHRLVAGIVSLLFAGLALAAWRRPGAAAARPFLLRAGLLLVAQVLLGALTVWHLLAAWTVTAHLVTGNAFNVCLLLAGLRLAGGEPAAAAPRAGRVLAACAATLLLVQVVLGGLVSSTYAGLACPAWPTCDGERWWPALSGSVGLHLLHRWNAVLLLAALAAAAVALRGVPRAARRAKLALALAAAQIAVGVANVWTHIPVEVTGLHSALAAALVLAVAAEVEAAWRPLARRSVFAGAVLDLDPGAAARLGPVGRKGTA
jgi:cytochrome c oxidase assembly protein subunit 15